MGKDQELLEAARNGNVLVVEKILNQRAKRSGPLASLRRGPGANVQDSSGYTPLHHAALNGHTEIVQMLLEHEASPNMPDAKGSSPLHLAAWAGHTHIVRLLLTHGPAITNVNLATRDSETALHCAAQYGHTAVVSMLLNHGADPTVRSVRDETALDLASQYGRLETVELLVRVHPELLEPYRSPRGIFPHTPLHRASRNGHKAVVNVLLAAGHAVNARTPSGTALHEAALCGKAEAARALLAGGADARARDTRGATVLDVLAQLPERATHDIVKLINKYRISNGVDSDSEDLPPIPLTGMTDGPDSPYDNVRSSHLIGGRTRHHQHHVWERRDEDERRVSNTSNISMKPNSDPLSQKAPVSPTNSSITTYDQPSKYMLMLTSKCFGLKNKTRSNASESSSPSTVEKTNDGNVLSKPKKDVKSKKNDTKKKKPELNFADILFKSKSESNVSTHRIGKSRFFRDKFHRSNEKLLILPKETSVKVVQNTPNVRRLSNSIRNSKRKAPSLPNIVENPEPSTESEDSSSSAKIVNNPMYENHDFNESSDSSDHVLDTKLKRSNLEDFVMSESESGEDGSFSKDIVNLNVDNYENSFLSKKSSFVFKRNSSESKKPKTMFSWKEESIVKKPLRHTHSNRTLKNWSEEQEEEFKTLADYSAVDFTSNSGQNNNKPKSMYYAMLDFSKMRNSSGHNIKLDEKHDYEVVNFDKINSDSKIKDSVEVADNIEDNSIPEMNFKLNVNLDSLQDKPATSSAPNVENSNQKESFAQDVNKTIQIIRRKNSLPLNNTSFHVESDNDTSILTDSSSSRSLSLCDSLSSPRSSQVSSYSWILEKNFRESVKDNTDAKSLSVLSEKENLQNMTSSNSVEVSSQRHSDISAVSFSSVDSSKNSNTLTGDDNPYLDMDALMKFSQKMLHLQQGNSISTLRQLSEPGESLYQNLIVIPSSPKKQLLSPILKTTYHLRGSENCIYDAPTDNELIYVLNHESINSLSIPPFLQVPRKILGSDPDSRICFCDGGQQKIYVSADNIFIDSQAHNETLNPEGILSVTKSFVCYCDSQICKFHHTREPEKSINMLTASYSPLKQSVSFPNLKILDDGNLNQRLSVPTAKYRPFTETFNISFETKLKKISNTSQYDQVPSTPVRCVNSPCALRYSTASSSRPMQDDNTYDYVVPNLLLSPYFKKETKQGDNKCKQKKETFVENADCHQKSITPSSLKYSQSLKIEQASRVKYPIKKRHSITRCQNVSKLIEKFSKQITSEESSGSQITVSILNDNSMTFLPKDKTLLPKPAPRKNINPNHCASFSIAETNIKEISRKLDNLSLPSSNYPIPSIRRGFVENYESEQKNKLKETNGDEHPFPLSKSTSAINTIESSKSKAVLSVHDIKETLTSSRTASNKSVKSRYETSYCSSSSTTDVSRLINELNELADEACANGPNIFERQTSFQNIFRNVSEADSKKDYVESELDDGHTDSKIKVFNIIHDETLDFDCDDGKISVKGSISGEGIRILDPNVDNCDDVAFSNSGGGVDSLDALHVCTDDCGVSLSPKGGRLCVRSGSDGGVHFPYSRSQMMDGSYHSEDLPPGYRAREPDQLSISSTTSSTGGPSPRERQRCGTNDSSVSGGNVYLPMATSGYHAHSPGSNNKVSPTPPKKPPRRNLSVSPTHLLPPLFPPPSSHQQQSGAVPIPHHQHQMGRAHQTRSQDDLDDLQAPGTKLASLRHGRSVDQYVDSEPKTSPRARPVPQPRPSLALLAATRKEQPVAISTMYENVVIKEQNPRRKLRRNTPTQNENCHIGESLLNTNQRYNSSQERSSLESLLDDVGTPSDVESSRPCRSRSTIQTPSSPTHYDQPPTPDHPPPSARQAEMSIHERMRPLSQEYKRMSRDMETETDPRLLGRCSSPSSSASTDHCVEEYVAEVPFAGLFKGSTTTLDGVGLRPTPAERPKSLRTLKSVYDGGGAAANRLPQQQQQHNSNSQVHYPNHQAYHSNQQAYHGDNHNQSYHGTVINQIDSRGMYKTELEDPWQYRTGKEPKDQHEKKDYGSNQSSGALEKSLSILSPFDEQEEWAKISEIMASFGSKLVRESVFAEELEREFQSRLGLAGAMARRSPSPAPEAMVQEKPDTIPAWLNSIGLPHLELNFLNNGYDEFNFINGVIEDNDFEEMAIAEPEKTKILDSSKTLPRKIDEVMSLPPNKDNHNNNISGKESEKDEEPDAVDKWLKSIGLECYQDTFRRHLYTDMERVRRIWEVELTAVLEIQRVGHRRRILASVAGSNNGPTTNMEDINTDLNNLQKNLQNLKAEIKDIPVVETTNILSQALQTSHTEQKSTAQKSPSIQSQPSIASNSNTLTHSQNSGALGQNSTTTTASGQTLTAPGGETLKRSHKKNRPPPPPPAARAAELEIRAPCELLVGVPGALKTQWRHQPFVLVTSSVMYVANYLGSTVVKELRGTESTQKSIQKLKKTNSEPRALPDIILSISYRGVKFLNTITRELVCEHEIRNIHCACQDADDLTHFAYITKDIASKSHYCHVFCVATMDQATEVILTLGQAFEVAYQMALRDLAPKPNPSPSNQQQQQTRSHSSNQIAPQSKTPTHDKVSSQTARDKTSAVHGRSHSVTEIKLNGHQLKVAPMTVSISNEDFQTTTKNGEVQKSPRTPSAKAPIAVAEEL